MPLARATSPFRPKVWAPGRGFRHTSAFVERQQSAVFDHLATGNKNVAHGGARLAIDQLAIKIVERHVSWIGGIEQDEIGRRPRRQNAEPLGASRRPRAADVERFEDFGRRGPVAPSSRVRLWTSPAALAASHKLCVSSTVASSVPSSRGTPALRSRRHGMVPLPKRILHTELCATVQPERASIAISASSTQIAWITSMRSSSRHRSSI